MWHHFVKINAKWKFSVQLSTNYHWYLGNSSLAHELRATAAVDLHENTTCFAQYPALKSVYEKKQSVIGGKLFPFYCIGQSLN